MNAISTIPEAIKSIRNGDMLIIVDDPGRENQGDLFFPAATVSAEKINTMIRDCRGILCAPVSREIARKFSLALMVEPSKNTEKHGCNFTVSVDSKNVTSFGISAKDRAMTISVLIDPLAKSSDLVRPGHVYPLLANDDGILGRAGHTEAAVDLAQLAGFPACGVICEILNDAGDPASMPELFEFAKQHSIAMISIADLIAYQNKHSSHEQVRGKIVTEVAQSMLPTSHGEFEIHVFTSIIDNREHVALLLKDDTVMSKPMLTRVHSKCFTGDTLSSLKCDCNAQLHLSMEVIQKNGSGLIIYLNQEGRGIGLANKIKAYALQEQGYDTVEANHMLGLPTDLRDYAIAADILDELGIASIDLLTNNPKKEEQLAAYGITIHSTVPLEAQPNAINRSYLKTKKNKLGHRLTRI
jgi:3,4-dihydroxy 2-butanone 4-phosphate synthase/GTP cyclohydrolase II